MTQIVQSLAEVSARYDALFVDLWGCVHNGITAYPDAVAALQTYRETGGKVVLLTNAPRPRADVERQIARMGVPEDAWDTVATSGDSARAAMFRGAVGRRVWFVGEDHDHSFFEPLKVIEDPVDVSEVSLDDADGIVCCGPFDPHADPSVLRPELLLAKQKGLKLLCANPDIVVDRGDRREWCAGAIARLYTEMGGESLYFGKPHPPIYDLARLRLSEIGDVPAAEGILAIGDGANTDIAGAMAEDIDSLFITGGLAAEETRTATQPEPKALEAYLAKEGISPTFAIGYLR
ncbi:TIGR01459 family HAD-type hydrolase [Roseivivax sediminis]|uniref:HAD-superfamily class IIA hydrolase, TIGR01459 n=1 Tax=Roseivivax sediminis TaxID=936889 RepID=A0A1I1ZPG2_9RHOB|nr:TIGR01459 family HAD-type hydrolase [Roseivivax sediminis]SFE32240.1 HAD-superfamily class IIA hydrolase, TIGR01459 [Roseivivax sediminis]